MSRLLWYVLEIVCMVYCTNENQPKLSSFPLLLNQTVLESHNDFFISDLYAFFLRQKSFRYVPYMLNMYYEGIFGVLQPHFSVIIFGNIDKPKMFWFFSILKLLPLVFDGTLQNISFFSSEPLTQKRLHQPPMPMWQTKYALAVPKNLGLGFYFRPCSEGNFLTGRPQSVLHPIANPQEL